MPPYAATQIGTNDARTGTRTARRFVTTNAARTCCIIGHLHPASLETPPLAVWNLGGFAFRLHTETLLRRTPRSARTGRSRRRGRSRIADCIGGRPPAPGDSRDHGTTEPCNA